MSLPLPPVLVVDDEKNMRLSLNSVLSDEDYAVHAVARCAERYRLLQENAALRARASETYRLEQIVGESPAMRELRQLIQTVAPTDARVLILGESGTGKELVAGALHGLSRRSKAAYVRINCAAIPETLLES